jgi:hypothetical protein
MKDFAVIPQGNTFIRQRNGFRFTETYLEYMAQKVRCAISLFFGEWFLNNSIGIPYIPSVMEKIDHRSILETALQVTISNVKGIKKLIEFAPSYNVKERLFRLKFIAQCENGETLEINEELPVQRMAS